MDKKTFYVCTICEGGKYYSYAKTISNCYNLIPIFRENKSLISVNACDTRREANEIAREWNAAYKRNGTNMF